MFAIAVAEAAATAFLFAHCIAYVVWVVIVSDAEPERFPFPSACRLFFHGVPFRVMLHESMPEAVQVTEMEPPEGTREGDAVMVACGERTVTLANAFVEPVLFEQVTL